jgi:gluconolactonase
MAVEVADRRLAGLVDVAAEPELLATGFGFVEGPVWDAAQDCLYFTDIKGDARRRWSARDGATVARRPNNKGNGMIFDAAGSLITCEHATSRVTRERDGRSEVLASHYQGRELNSPNDVVVSRSGAIYFTDPFFGRVSADLGIVRDQELDFQGLFLITPGGELELLDDDFDQPNGLCFSPDEDVLYVNDCRANFIRRYEVRADGSLGARSVLVDGFAGFDGMKCDEHGNLYITGTTGILVFDDRGTHLGTLGLPENPANLNWGQAAGPAWSDLYICARTSLYRYSLTVAGAPCPYMTRPRS